MLQETCEAPDGSQDCAHRQVERQHKIKHERLNCITFLDQEYNKIALNFYIFKVVLKL